jgi:hypothetical protein
VVRNMSDADEIVAFGLLERDDMSEMRSDEAAQQQRERTEAMAPYVESIGADGIYEVIDEVET